MIQPINTGEPDFDVIVIGAGFGGCYLLKRLRDAGFRTHIFEEAGGLGGVWWHNRYPGCRVDNDCPHYEYSDPELWTDWTWTELFPSQIELAKYFEYVDRKWLLSQDISFNTKVETASFDSSESCWTIRTSTNDSVTGRYLLPAMGFAAKLYTPQFEGLEQFQGVICHPARWPTEHGSFAGQRIGVMGTGATGVQLIQELAPTAESMVVFQRSPNFCLPMRQKTLDPAEILKAKKTYPELFRQIRLTSTIGTGHERLARSALDDTPEARRAVYEKIWQQGGWAPSHANYADLLTNIECNHFFYEFWREKTLERLQGVDEETIENLAPLKPPVPFGTKRPSMEQNYFEAFKLPSTRLVALKKNPISHFTSTGVQMMDGTNFELDVLVLATGYDAVTGSFARVEIRGLQGQKLNDKWKDGANTALGLATAGFPNMFFLYGPQSPAAFAAGPLACEIQGDWIVEVLSRMSDRGHTFFDAKPEAETYWSSMLIKQCRKTLYHLNDTTWYMGGNIPGKPFQPLCFMGGLPAYQEALRKSIESDLSEFVVA